MNYINGYQETINKGISGLRYFKGKIHEKKISVS